MNAHRAQITHDPQLSLPPSMRSVFSCPHFSPPLLADVRTRSMEFEHSTQARSWMFDGSSLAVCRERAVGGAAESRTTKNRLSQVRKFASGFHRTHVNLSDTSTPPPSDITPSEQEVLVQFHAHQIQTLVGPAALLSDLRTSETVLSTAIMFFRRFYLSNSIIEISPRKIAVACAFFASKAEEERIEVRVYSSKPSQISMVSLHQGRARREFSGHREKFGHRGVNYLQSRRLYANFLP